MTLPRLEYEYIQNKNFIIFPEKKGVNRKSFKLKLEKKKRNKFTRKIKITKKRKNKSLSSKSIFGIF